MRRQRIPKPALRVFGARQNNLKGFDLSIPHDALTAVTGVSGSGKSSLAFDTLFAEGQWRYLESLPSYARMLMEKAARPDIDAIENVRPAIALEQRNTVRAARSTVGTLTEVYDLLRLLYAAVGEYRCVECGRDVRAFTPATAAREAAERLPTGQFTLETDLGEKLKNQGGEPGAWRETLSANGFARVRLAKGKILRLDDDSSVEELPTLAPPGAALVLDRLRLPEDAARLARAFDEAYRNGGPLLRARSDDGTVLDFPSDRVCRNCGRPAPDLRPVLFSYNHPLGACPECTGFGAVLVWDPLKIVPDPSLTLAGGAIEPWQKPANGWWQENLLLHARAEAIPLDIPWAKLPERARAKVWKGSHGLEGVEGFFNYLETKRYKMHVRVFLSRYRSPRTCPSCGGARLRPEVLSVRVGGRSISEVSDLPLNELNKFVRGLSGLEAAKGSEILWRVEDRLATLLRLGLHYLSLSRPSRTLSGGEMQRVALSRQLSNRLTETLYVLDEPSVGLHPRDTDALAEVLGELTGRGNTVVFVEHDLRMISRADHVVELGPGGGRDGGRLVYEGDVEGLKAADTPTGRYLRRRGENAWKEPRPPRGWLTLSGCNLHNLNNIDVAFPLGVLTCITGVSGSGKSTLLEDTLLPAARSRGAYGPVEGFTVEGAEGEGFDVRAIDQDPMGRTPRSIPLTYVDAMTPIRKLFGDLPGARKLGLTAGHFSFNTPHGRCPRCEGAGHERIEMLFFEDLYVPCSLCEGKRFRPEVLTVRYQGRNIHEVLRLSVDEAAEAFRGVKGVEKPLALLGEMGLGYLVLGQPATTLSGGEAQRLKIAAELLAPGRRRTLYLLDEPTTGLHGEDVAKLAAVLHRLVDRGDTVIVVEHDLDFIRQADWLVDLGPEGGTEGGLLVDAGPPREIARRALGYTGRYLAKG
jgi:excinuclease ABC subunit A